MANTYHAGLCGCFSDPAVCCVTCLCPSITVAQTMQRFENSDDFLGNCLPVMLVDLFTGNLGSAIFGCQNRQQYRAAYKIPGNACSDGCVFCFCTCCAVIQDAREVKIRQRYSVKQQVVQMTAPQNLVFVPIGQSPAPTAPAVVMGYPQYAPGPYQAPHPGPYPASVPGPYPTTYSGASVPS
mmetsp:Transcript_9359/g.15408  ORF Transcript_9359/g.15408 Transcript_9359/m.15408 type:complete len:182 (-) Transcript_9359:435-980(-)